MKKLIFIILLSILMTTTIIYSKGNASMKDEPSDVYKEFTICIDPGHQEKGDSKSEPVAPGSGQRKARVSQGTAGISTKKAEYVVNLEASIILKEILEGKGYKVIMTRECHDINISNAERAEVANKCKVDLAIRIHCDSLKDSSKTGTVILVPSKNGENTKSIFEDSNRYARILQTKLKKSGIKVNGVLERGDITGFNWSQVPVVIFEMGFMSNWNEDKMLSDPSYQKKLMEIVAQSIDEYKEGAISE